jgi:hypothetical protein
MEGLEGGRAKIAKARRKVIVSDGGIITASTSAMSISRRAISSLAWLEKRKLIFRKPGPPV